MMTAPKRQCIRVGTRGSQLALAQTQMVVDHLQRAWPDMTFEIQTIRTRGDQEVTAALPDIGGKGLFTAELEQALRDGRIDCAVHSAKDLPAVLDDDVHIAAVPLREDVRDVLISRTRCSLADLPPDAVLGTSSVRRQAQIALLREDVSFTTIRGNVDTRIAKVERGECDATILAAAGLRRCGLIDRADQVFDVTELLPAPGQGALALQARTDDRNTEQVLRVVHDTMTANCLDVERRILALLEAGCHVPLAVLADYDDGEIRVRATLYGDNGVVLATAEDWGIPWDRIAVAERVAEIIRPHMSS